MRVELPDLCLVLLIGASSAGKSTFAHKHFLPTEIVSSDACRAMVSDDETDQSATEDAFDLVHRIAAMRLKHRRLTVIDATNLSPDWRRPLLRIAREYYTPAVAILVEVHEDLAQERNRRRPDRDVPPEVIHKHITRMPGSKADLLREGFHRVFIIPGADVNSAVVERRPLPADRRDLTGPFDAIGDVHGCTEELEALAGMLGYQKVAAEPVPWQTYPYRFTHPDGRMLLFVGDLVDRGPRILETFQLVYNTVNAGRALVVPGNHDDKLMRWLKGRSVKVSHGLENSLAEIHALPEAVREPFKENMRLFFESLPSHLLLDQGRLALAHAGLKESMLGRWGGRVRDFTLYGETSGESDEFGHPIRYNWAINYKGKTKIVYGHTPVVEPEWLHNTINIDTGCVFGGYLTALRYPELEVISVSSQQMYSQPTRPLGSGMVDPPQTE